MEKRSEAETESRERTTHAGGVVHRTEDTGVKYLLVGPKTDRPGEWLFPKGHIENGEQPEAAGQREVLEEAGVVAAVICPLGVNKFESSEKYIVVSYFLMKHLRDSPNQKTDQRRVAWLGFDEALNALTHVENKHLLREAERKRIAGCRPPTD